MNIRSLPNYITSFFAENVLPSLTDLEKKISLVALAILSCAGVYLICRKLGFIGKEVTREMKAEGLLKSKPEGSWLVSLQNNVYILSYKTDNLVWHMGLCEKESDIDQILKDTEESFELNLLVENLIRPSAEISNTGSEDELINPTQVFDKTCKMDSNSANKYLKKHPNKNAWLVRWSEKDKGGYYFSYKYMDITKETKFVHNLIGNDIKQVNKNLKDKVNELNLIIKEKNGNLIKLTKESRVSNEEVPEFGIKKNVFVW